MIKGTTTIKADDTTSAMEKVVSQLGEDCVILSTKKKNGKIEITASNSPKHKSSVKKRYDKKKFENIYKLRAGKLDIKKSINTTEDKSNNLTISNLIRRLVLLGTNKTFLSVRIIFWLGKINFNIGATVTLI